MRRYLLVELELDPLAWSSCHPPELVDEVTEALDAIPGCLVARVQPGRHIYNPPITNEVRR